MVLKLSDASDTSMKPQRDIELRSTYVTELYDKNHINVVGLQTSVKHKRWCPGYDSCEHM